MAENSFPFQLVSAFEKQGVRFILVGGFAVNFHGFSRNTQDMDFLICEDDFSKAEEALKGLDYEGYSRTENFAQFKAGRLGFMDVDLMFVTRETFEHMYADRAKGSLGGAEVSVPSLKNLIALKLHSMKNNRYRILSDMEDVVRLMKKHAMDPRGAGFRALCTKYGTDEIYSKILLMWE